MVVMVFIYCIDKGSVVYMGNFNVKMFIVVYI